MARYSCSHAPRIAIASYMHFAGFASAMAQALEGGDYRTYGYSCAGAIGYGSTGSWTSAFGQVCFSHVLQNVGPP